MRAYTRSGSICQEKTLEEYTICNALLSQITTLSHQTEKRQPISSNLYESCHDNWTHNATKKTFKLFQVPLEEHH